MRNGSRHGRPSVCARCNCAGPVSRHAATPPNTTPAPAAPTNISDKKLDAVVAASKQVSAVRGTYEQKVAQAPAAEKERLIGEANAAIKKAVTDQGLSLEEYNTIVEVAQKDPAVRDKLLQRMR